MINIKAIDNNWFHNKLKKVLSFLDYWLRMY